MIKVLVVDDDEDLLEMVTLMLIASNMQVTALSKGGLLAEALKKEMPDVLLMDIFLGDSDGRQLCRELKNAGNYAGMPVFLYSAGEISPSSIVESAADYFLHKPFDMSHLVGRIQQSVKK